MTKAVILGADNIVKNVIKLADGVDHPVDAGEQMSRVAADVHVGPGMLFDGLKYSYVNEQGDIDEAAERIDVHSRLAALEAQMAALIIKVGP